MSEGSLDALTGRIEERELTQEMRSSYLDYAMSVIVGRALPDVRDGFKPVHRRVLYAMHDLALQPNRPYRKSAFIVGEVMGKYHPHGDSAIYDTLVRMAQEFSLRYPLVDGQGNFGSIDDDPAAAMRYTEARLARLATEMLRDIDADTVDFGPNYDESQSEPLVLPARFPNLLVNGSSGIAVGMATNIPPHNLSESIGAVKAYMREPRDRPRRADGAHQGPRLPRRRADEHGGHPRRLRLRPRLGQGPRPRPRRAAQGRPARRSSSRSSRSMVKKGGDGGLITKIADLVREKKINGISDLRDESDRSGMRLVIELKRGGDPAEVVLNQLYKHTQMQNTFGVNMVALVDGVPRTLSLKELIEHYVDHQREVVTRRTQYELRRAEARAHILEGLLIALDNLDAVIELIRGSADTDDGARRPDREVRALRAAGAGDPRHAPRQRLTALESDKVRAEHAELLEQIAELRAILGDPARIDALIVDELDEIERALRRRAAHRDHPLRGRHEHRGHDRRPADGDLDHPLRLRQAPAAGHLSPAAPRRRRRDGDGHEGGRLHRAPAHLLDPRLPALLHQPRQGLPAQGLRAARGLADLEGPGAGQRAAAARRRAGDGRDPDPRLQRGQVPGLRDRQGPGQEDRVPRLQHADPRRRDHRDQGPRRRRARPGAADRPARTTCCWSRSPATPRASARRRCARWAATPPGSRA